MSPAPDVILEFRLRDDVRDVLNVAELRAPLFFEQGNDLAFGATIDLRGVGPVQPGRTFQAPARFVFPEGAQAHFAAGAPFWSHAIEGRIVRWVSAQVAAE